MYEVHPGDRILVPITAQSGAFPSECLVTFETNDGPVSGFIQSSQIQDDKGAKFLEGEVLKVTSDTLTVKLHGSFFTTNGIAHISSRTHYRVAA